MSEATQPTISGIPDLPKEDRPIPQRNTYVASWYLEEPHTDMNQQIYEVTEHGRVPLVHRGVHVKVGMVPPEHRYAIKLDGTLCDQREFAELNERHYLGFFALLARLNPGANIRPDDSSLRPVPNVRNFITHFGLKPDQKGYQEIGYDPRKRVDTSHIRPAPDDSGDPVVDPSMLQQSGYRQKLDEVVSEKDEKISEQNEEIEKLQAEISDLKNRALQKPNSRGEMMTAPCGKEIRDGYLAQHARHCDVCSGDPPKEAA